jgi:hypothetical protein
VTTTASATQEIVAVVVAVDSPLGRAVEAVDELTAHLPSPREPQSCPLCPTQSWPCTAFHTAAHHIHAARLWIGELVPPYLHPRLWPAPPRLSIYTDPVDSDHSPES